ncbi:hypothetical protein ACLB2K_050836 [Fragaria x ananassa]
MGYVKFNVDAAYQNVVGRTGIGGVFRDHDGGCPGVFSKMLSAISSARHGELLAALIEGGCLAITHNLFPVVVESDCQVLVDAIRNGTLDNSELRLLVYDLRVGLSLASSVSLKFIRRSVNDVAHTLAPNALESEKRSSSTTSPRNPVHPNSSGDMETSEKRKERLRAMRLEAEASHNDTTADVPGYLSNPLADGNVAQEEPCAPSRFGFYTDPMAGFSADTKRCKGDHFALNSFKHSDAGGLPVPRLPPPLSGRPMNPEMPPAPHQFQSNYSPDQRMYQQNFAPQRSPAGMVRPFAMHHGNPPELWNGAEGPANYNFSSDPSRESRSTGPRFRPPGSPGYRPPGSPGFGPSGSPEFGLLGSPGFEPPGILGYGPPRNPGFRPLGNAGFGPPGSPGFGPSGSPGFRPPGSPRYRPPGSPGYRPPGSPGFSSNTWQGRGNWAGHSPSPHSVHGGSHSPSSSSGRGRGHFGSEGRGGRGRGSHYHPFRPEQFYNASMVEDPWKGLPPVTWQALGPVFRKEVDTPFNGNKNKASISESSNRSTPQPNLAEYLAASLNEAINEEPNETTNEEPTS